MKNYLRLFLIFAVSAGLTACGTSTTSSVGGVCSPTLPSASFNYANSGRNLTPYGTLTSVGDFPTGGALSPTGTYFWSISSGHGQNDVRIVNILTNQVIQTIPLPGAYGQVAFTPDGKTAFVSGEPAGAYKNSPSHSSWTYGANGDVIHVFNIASNGLATETTSLTIPAITSSNGNLKGIARTTYSNPTNTGTSWPIGLATSPDGRYLVVALQMADSAIIFDLKNNTNEVVGVGHYPIGAAVDNSGNAYISNGYDGTVSKFPLALGQGTKTPTLIQHLAGTAGDNNSQPQALVQDPKNAIMYVAVTNKDAIAVIDENTNTVIQVINMQRKEGVFGSQPLSLAITPDGNTLLSANAGENAIVAINLNANSTTAKYAIIGKLPTADYPTAVSVTSDGCNMVWNSARGVGTGANGGAAVPANKTYTTFVTTPTGTDSYGYDMDNLTGIVGVSPIPTAATFAALSGIVDAGMYPSNFVGPPSQTPIHGSLISSTGGLKSYNPSGQIKYVFYIVKENRTYDQLYGADPRGNGDPTLQIFGDNCSGSCTKADNLTIGNGVGWRNGVTPNQHALTRQFSLMDNFYENSEVSVDGHIITSAAYATNYTLRSSHADYSGRGRPGSEEGIYPVTFAPKYFLWDQMAAQNISFQIYGELDGNPLSGFEVARSATPANPSAAVANTNKILSSSDYRLDPVTQPLFNQLISSLSGYGVNATPGATYAGNTYNGCLLGPTNSTALYYSGLIATATGGAISTRYVNIANPLCAYDSYISTPTNGVSPSINGIPLSALGQLAPLSRMDAFKAKFTAQVANCNAGNASNPSACSVPQLNYMIMMSDHTYGVSPGSRDPFAAVADNDLGVGQLVDLISHSAIWPYTAIFVVEDDAQDGADHVDAHRAPALVISPYSALGGQLVHTRYDQYSVLRTIELILGINPLSTYDGLATPMYDAFTTTPVTTPFTAIQPTHPLFAYVPAATDNPSIAMMDLSKRLPWNKVDVIPGEITDRLLYQYAKSKGMKQVNYTGPGPHASPYERQRAKRVMEIYNATKNYPDLSRRLISFYLTNTAKDKD